jgi:CheY-like chemotaxis protein
MARILVIDDEELVRASIQITLESDGHEVVLADDGRTGIARQSERPFDLIITDIVMPNKEGMETIIELRQEYRDPKIIAISGGARSRNADYLTAAKNLGATATLAKPFSNDELLQCVAECLDQFAASTPI